MKGLMKNFSGGLTILKERRIIGLLKECGGVYGKSFGRLTAEEVDCLREREKKDVWVFGKQPRRIVYDINEWQGFMNGGRKNVRALVRGMTP